MHKMELLPWTISIIDMLNIFAFMETEYSTASSVESNIANTPE